MGAMTTSRSRRRRSSSSSSSNGGAVVVVVRNKLSPPPPAVLLDHLPHHLLISILAFLPVLKLVQLRLVCKSWNSLLRSPAFLRTWCAQPSSSRDCWFVMSWNPLHRERERELIAYCPSLHHWFPLPGLHSDSTTISSFLGTASFRVAFQDNTCGDRPSLSAVLMASAGGLMCCLLNGAPPPALPEFEDAPLPCDECDSTVVVLNYLTRAVQSLPKPPKLDGCLACRDEISLSMIADSATNSYHVVLSDVTGNLRDMGFHHLAIYSSKTGCWRVGQPITSGEFAGDVQKGDLFSYDETHSVLSAYNIESDAWSKVQLLDPCPEKEDDEPHVFKCNGRILLVSAPSITLPTSDTIIQGFTVWELQLSSHGTANWVEVARTPPKYYEVASLGYYYYVNFVHSETLICMTVVDADGEVTYWPPLVYDLVLGSWYHLPPYKGTFDVLAVLAYQPRFTAMV